MQTFVQAIARPFWSGATLLALAWLASNCLAFPEDKLLSAPKKGPLSLHVLNTTTGKPAAGVEVTLQRQTNKGWAELRKGQTNEKGRIDDLAAEDHRLQVGVYRLIFETGAYFRAQGQKSFFPRVEVVFEVDNSDEHYHVPLLLSPFGYSTYRGS